MSSAREAAHAALLSAQELYEQGQLEAAVAQAESASQILESLAPVEDEDRLEAITLLGLLARDTGRFEAAAHHFEAALWLARRFGNAERESDVLNLWAGILGEQGEYAAALELLGEALALARSLGVGERQGAVLSNIGTLYILLGDLPRALEALTEAYTLLHQAAPGSFVEATNFLSLGELYEKLGNFAEARRFFNHARDAGQRTQNILVEMAALNNLANIALRSCVYGDAQELFGAALELARSVGQRQYEIDNLDGLGEVYRALGDVAAATEVHAEALAIARDIGDSEGETDALLNLGQNYLELGDAARALPMLHEGLGRAQVTGLQPSVYQAYRGLSAAYETLGETGRALTYFKAFHEAEKAVHNAENERRTQQLSVQFGLERARAAAAKERLRSDLFREARDEAEAQVRRRTEELEAAQLEVVTRLALAAEYRDDSTGDHTKRVGRNAAALAYTLGWPAADTELLFLAARLHDVGKLAVPDAILHKPGRLEPAERYLMQTHTLVGSRILSAGRTRLLKLAEEVALAHHERWDGAGYPHGLAGEAVPFSARIVAVADVLDALVHTRPYKAAWSVADALQEIAEQSGLQFDPAVARACLEVFGPDGPLCPLEAPQDWPSTLERLKGVSGPD